MSIVDENRRRCELLVAPYDPVRGVGCYGERFRLDLSDMGTYYLPKEMEGMWVVELLGLYGSLAGAVRDGLGVKDKDGSYGSYLWYLLCEERYLYDFEFYAYCCDTIRDKQSGADVRFRLNRPQRLVLLPALEVPRREGRQILVQVLKARQMGFSTLVQMYMGWIQCVHRKNWNSVVCADDLTSAVNVRSIYDVSIGAMPPLGGVKLSIAPFAGTQNIKVIPERGCRITVGTAQRPETVRSQDVKMVHFSEVAFYPHTGSNDPSKLESSIISSIPNVPYTMVVRESTANGVGDYFHEQWERAKGGLSGYSAVFAPWYMMEIYRVELEGRYWSADGSELLSGGVEEFVGSLTEYERRIFGASDYCTLEHLNWRRWKLGTMSDVSKMTQEFPSDDVEAFLDSGSPVFNAEDVEALRGECSVPIAVGEVVGREEAGLALVDAGVRRGVLEELKFVEDEAVTRRVRGGELGAGMGRLSVWEYPDRSVAMRDRYVVSFDPQRGVSDSADYGVIKVFDRYWMSEGEVPSVVAMWWGRVDKDIAIWVAAQIAKWYCGAVLVVESNTYDSVVRDDDTEFIFDVIADYYGNLYARTDSERIREGLPIKYGFHTNKSSKPMVINHYKGLLRERGYVERDAGTLDEARVYEVKENGSMGAKVGKHDDRLMATAIGLYVCYELDVPRVINKRKTKRRV